MLLKVRALHFANSQGTELVGVYKWHGRVQYLSTGEGGLLYWNGQ